MRSSRDPFKHIDVSNVEIHFQRIASDFQAIFVYVELIHIKCLQKQTRIKYELRIQHKFILPNQLD